MTDTIRVNDQVLSWTSTEFKALGVPYVGIMSIDFSQTRKRKSVFGMKKDGRQIGRTRGKYEPGAVTMRWLAESYDILTDQLTPLGLGSYGSARWTASLSGFEIGGKPLLWIFEDLIIDEDKVSAAEGIDELAYDVVMNVRGITLNGKTLYSRGGVR